MEQVKDRSGERAEETKRNLRDETPNTSDKADGGAPFRFKDWASI